MKAEGRLGCLEKDDLYTIDLLVLLYPTCLNSLRCMIMERLSLFLAPA